MTFHDIRRRVTSSVMTVFCAGSVLLALVPLVAILFFVVAKGAGSLNWAFFTELPKPVGETGGGMANALLGSLTMCGLGALFAIPIGIMSGIYIVESRSKFAPLVRFAADALNGVPSIVIGMFIYVIAVVPFKQFSAMAGGMALGVMMIPLITRTTEEFLRLVPGSLREGALALGATRSRAVFSVVLPAALPGIITGVVLSLARIAGETAPLLFTALGTPYWSTKLTEPMASMTVQIYKYAQSPYDDWHRQAWAGAFVLVVIVLICSILARLATLRLARMKVSD
jgi:phosphate transport system permease protein